MSGPLGEVLNPGEHEGLPEDLFTNPAKYDGDIHFWQKTVIFTKQYLNTRPTKRAALFNQLAPVLQNFGNLIQINNNLDLISQVASDVPTEEIRDGLISQVTEAISRTKPGSWKPEKIEELIKYGTSVPEDLKPAFQKFQIALFRTPRTIAEAVELHYNAAWAMVETRGPEVREEIFTILVLEKPWLTERSLSVLLLPLAVLSDTLSANKFAAINLAMQTTDILRAIMTRERFNMKDSRSTIRMKKIGDVFDHPEAKLHPQVHEMLRRNILSLGRKDPRKLFDAIESTKTSTIPDSFEDVTQEIEDATIKIWREDSYLEKWATYKEQRDKHMIEQKALGMPSNFFKEPLGEKIYQTIMPYLSRTQSEFEMTYYKSQGGTVLTPNAIQLPGGFQIKIISDLKLETDGERAQVVNEVCETLLSGRPSNSNRSFSKPMDKVLEAAGDMIAFTEHFDTDSHIVFFIAKASIDEEVGSLASIIEYHRPMLSAEQTQLIELQSSDIRKEISNGFIRAVGRRGYEAIISDQALRQFGYESITFKQSQDSENITASLRIRGQNYEFLLDDNYRFIMGKDILKFNGKQDQAWLELLVLSFLKKVMCTENDDDKLKEALLSPADQLPIFRRQTIHRTEYLRRLPIGYHYSTEAFEKCLKSSLPEKNLHTINERRLQSGLDPVTYVSPSEKVDTQIANPVKIVFKDDAREIRDFISLGEISQEETARIEREILRELQIS